MIINEGKLNESKLDTSGITVDPTPYDYEEFKAVNLILKDRKTQKTFDNMSKIRELSKLLNYNVEFEVISRLINEHTRLAAIDILNKRNRCINDDYIGRDNKCMIF